MKLYLPLLSFAIVLVSCSTSYKSGQTPDDVYFSPERQRDEYVRVEEKDDRQYSSEEAREDRYLRMKTTYRRYAYLDDCNCFCSFGNYSRYDDYYRYNNYGYNRAVYWNTWNNYNPYYYNPYYNKPYYSGYVAGSVNYTRPRTGNLNTYYNGNNSSTNTPRSNGKNYNNNNSYNNSNTKNPGSTLRDAFSSGRSNSSSNSSNSSSNSSSSSGSSSGSSAPVRKF